MAYQSFSLLDSFLIEFQNSVLHHKAAQRVCPGDAVAESDLSASEKTLAAGLMRVNHAGEVCAQALYLGQAFVARDAKTRDHLLEAAEEEADHLHWCAQRVHELGSHTSALNFAWFSLSVMTGMLAGLASDKISLGFIAETESQVEAHLSGHLQRLPAQDLKSRAIVKQMQLDEIQHKDDALAAGGEALPNFVKLFMTLTAKVMTKTAHYF